MSKSYSWQEIADMPLCCMCCGSRNVIAEKNLCLDCGSDEGLWADERTDEIPEHLRHLSDKALNSLFYLFRGGVR
jgi:hypothetical protein